MPGSVRALRRTYGRLHAEGHVDNKAAILVRVGEKLASENKILRKENEGLRGAIFEEKRKRKRGKTLDFYKGEQAVSSIFQSCQSYSGARTCGRAGKGKTSTTTYGGR